jgi:hypothetical protein
MRTFSLAALTLALAASALGCGPDDSTPGIRFTGARNGSAPWNNRASFWSELTDRSLTTMPTNFADDASSALIRVELGQAGEPRAGAFRDSVDGDGCFVSFEYLGGPAWSTKLPGIGNDCSFDFTSVRMLTETTGSTGRVRTYEIHGSFRGKLNAASGSTGTIDISGTF